MDAIRRDISWQNGWDAAIDAAAKGLEDAINRHAEKTLDGFIDFEDAKNAILALKGNSDEQQ